MRKNFSIKNTAWLFGMAVMYVIVLAPVYIIFKYSISGKDSIVLPPGEPVPFWPFAPTFEVYEYVAAAAEFMSSFTASVNVALITVGLSLLMGGKL